MVHTIKLKLKKQNSDSNVITGTIIKRDGIKTKESLMDCGNHIAVTRDICFGKNVDLNDKVSTITISE